MRNPKQSSQCLPMSVKTEVADAVVIMCATDIRPFNIVEGEGFKKMANKFIEIGAKYGKVDSADMIPAATTVSRHLSSVYDTEKSLLEAALHNVQSCGVTCDLWTHDSTNASYITVTIHYVDSKWQLVPRIIATRRVDESHTAECIREHVMSILQEFGCCNAGNVYVTDNASNMKAAFREFTWIGCSGHNLNLVLSHGLQSTKEPKDGITCEVAEQIETCKQLVTLAKRTKLNSHLQTTMKQCVVTRQLKCVSILLSEF